MRTLEVVAGAQYGSEAKGHVTHRLLQQQISGSWSASGHSVAVVRVAGPNAGHTVYNNRGIKFALRQVPVGAVEDDVTLVIAAGSEIDPAVLLDEIQTLQDSGHDLSGRLVIDDEATLIDQEHRDRETDLVTKIGSTGKGIGAARADRLLRKAHRVKDDPVLMSLLDDLGVTVGDTGAWLSNNHSLRHVIIEGTQGYGLGLHAGHYPQVTSSDCRAIDFMAMAGVAPWGFQRINVWLVARVYPIRVAGNSGPLAGETTWEELGLQPEFTTVTKKMRRVGQWDGDLIRRAVVANGGVGSVGAVKIALTMVDQKIPGLADKGREDRLRPDDQWALDGLISQVEKDAGVPVGMITTGPRSGWLL